MFGIPSFTCVGADSQQGLGYCGLRPDPCCSSNARLSQLRANTREKLSTVSAGENCFSPRELSKMQLLVQPLELNGSWRCHSAGVGSVEVEVTCVPLLDST